MSNNQSPISKGEEGGIRRRGTRDRGEFPEVGGPRSEVRVGEREYSMSKGGYFQKYMPAGAMHFRGLFSGWYMSMKI